jgi:hypothetical protein
VLVIAFLFCLSLQQLGAARTADDLSRGWPIHGPVFTDARSSKPQIYWMMNGIMLRRHTGTSPITTYKNGADGRITSVT